MKNRRYFIIGLGSVALLSIIIGVIVLVKGNNDISSVGKNASFGVLGKNGTAFSSITYSHIQNNEYYYDVKYFAESKKDAICGITYHITYEKPMEKPLTEEEKDAFYEEKYRSFDEYTDLSTSITVPKENKYGALVEEIRVFLLPCDDSLAPSYTINPETDNKNLEPPHIIINKDENLYNDNTAVLNIDSYAKNRDETFFNTMFKNTYYVDGQKVKETFAEDNTSIQDTLTVERTTNPKVLTVIAEDNKGNIEIFKALIQAKDHTGPYCYFDSKDQNLSLTIGETKNVTLHCISDIGERIDSDRDYETNYQPELMYSDNIEIEYKTLDGWINTSYGIDEMLERIKITAKTPGKTTLKFKNGSIADTNSDFLDTNYGGKEYIAMNIEVIDKKDEKAPTCQFAMGDVSSDANFYVGSKIKYTVMCEDDVKFDASNLNFNTKKINIWNNGELLESHFYATDYQYMPRKVLYTFEVIPIKSGELSVDIKGGFVQDASGRNSKASYTTTYNIVEPPKDIKRPTCKIETDKDEITIGESVNATITCIADKKISSTATLGVDITGPNISNFHNDESPKKSVLTFKITPSNVGKAEIVLKENVFFNEIDMGNKEVVKTVTVKERIKDTTGPVCTFKSDITKIKVGKTGKVYLTCDDPSGIKNTNLSVSNIGVNKFLRISLLKIQSVKLISETATSCTWEIDVKGNGLGKATLFLNENSVSDKFDNKNTKSTATTPLKVTLF